MQPDEHGSVTLLVECPDGQDFAYLGILKIDGTFSSPGEHRLPADPLDGPPIVTAKAWAIGDGATGELLWGQNDSASRQMASTTKIMTAWIVLELAAEKPELLTETIVVSELADKTGGTTAGLRAGERISVADVLYGLLLPSGNDAAVALAEHFGNRLPDDPTAKTKDKDPVSKFTAEMNRRAGQLGMKETHYLDPHGNSGNRSSARDLLRLGFRAMQNKALRSYVNTRQHECKVAAVDESVRTVTWKNTNRLLDIAGFDGIKTGGAGNCLVSSGQRGDDRLLVVVLGATSQEGRFVDSRNLFRWAWRMREPQQPAACAAGMNLEDVEKQFGPPVMRVAKPEHSAVVDGRLDDAAWRASPAVALGMAVGGWSSPSQATEARVLADERALYLGVRCFEASPEKMRAAPRERMGKVNSGDTVELFLDPGHRERLAECFHVSVNPRGIVYAARGLDPDGWTPSITARSAEFEGGWTIEVAIPFADLGLKEGRIPKVWRLNINRQRPELGVVMPKITPGTTRYTPQVRPLDERQLYRDGEYTGWAPTYSDYSYGDSRPFHHPHRLGHAVLEVGTEDVKPPEARQ